jgi:putative ABC transport system substrate-binding protein
VIRLTRRALVAGTMAAGVSAGLALLGSRLGPGPTDHVSIGMLGGGSSTSIERVNALVQGLREYGWVEGQNLTIVTRHSAEVDQFPQLAAELVASDVRLIVFGVTPTAAVVRAAERLPIVMTGSDDPVARGFAASLAHPGGNVTGLTSATGPDIAAKRVELIKELIPAARRLAFMINLGILGREGDVEVVQTASSGLGLELQVLDVRTITEIGPAFSEADNWAADALYIYGGSPAALVRAEVTQLATQHRLPAIYVSREYALDGGLIVYGSSVVAQWRRTAFYVDRILRGTNPGDLPIERPAAFDLVINVTTAADLHLTVPRALAAQVTEWIQ